MLLAFAAFWLSSFGALKHTDDLSQLVSSSTVIAVSAARANAPAIVAAPHPKGAAQKALADDCATCRWQQTAQNIPTIFTAVALIPIERFRQPAAAIRSQQRFAVLRASLRAPPHS